MTTDAVEVTGKVVGNAPTEGKVWASSIGGTAGATIGGFLSWVLGVTVWGAPSDAGHAKEAVLAVPDPVSAVLMLGLTFGLAYGAGWLAKHSPRPLLAAVEDTTATAAQTPAQPVQGAQIDTEGL